MSLDKPAAPSGAEAIREIASLAAQARGIDIVTVKAPEGLRNVPPEIPVGIRHGASPETVDLSRLFESYRERPERKTGTARALTLASFIDLTNTHKVAESVVFANTDWKQPSFQSVIDYHGASGEAASGAWEGEPGNLKHRIRYEFPLSEEWKAWVEVNGSGLSQADFAAFIEDRIAELASPMDAEKIQLERDFQTTVATPADVLRLSRGLQVNVNSQVKQIVTLQTGEGQLTWDEGHTDGDGKPLKVPGIFLVSVAPFFMGDPVRIPARLRYRVSAGKVTWSILLYRPDKYVTERVREDLDKVARETGLPAFEGSPES